MLIKNLGLFIKSLHFSLSCIILVITLSGCSSTRFVDLFSGYSQQMSKVRIAQQKGDFVMAQQFINDISSSHNAYALTQLEKGRLNFLSHNSQNSQKNFEEAYSKIQAAQAKAKIQISRGVNNLGAVIVNDNVLTYDIPYYEQSMLHSYQALNYLYQHQLESALVEIRRANFVQERALAENEHNIAKTQQKMIEKGISNKELNKSYPSMELVIGELKNGFQNAYTFYLSGLMFEAAGETNDAYIDYKKALEIFPNNHFLQQDILRLANVLNMTDDLKIYNQQYGEYKLSDNDNNGQVAIIVEQGIVNEKHEAAVNLPLYTSSNDLRFFSFALPIYKNEVIENTPLSVFYNNKYYQSEEIVRLHALAAKNLQEQLPALYTRQALRILAKEQFRRKMSKEGGDIGNILASLYNIASENADTRSWSTLPKCVHILRLNLPKGPQQLKVSINGKEQIINVEINANRITLINLTVIDNYSDYQVINL